MIAKASTIAPDYRPAEPASVNHGAFVELDGPPSLHDLRMILMRFEDLKVPDDAWISWGYPRIWANWKRS